jgi:hypothetical protein
MSQNMSVVINYRDYKKVYIRICDDAGNVIYENDDAIYRYSNDGDFDIGFDISSDGQVVIHPEIEYDNGDGI